MAGSWQNSSVDYTDFMWIKFVVIVIAAFVYGIWRGLNGR